MFGVLNRGELDPTAEHEFENLNSRLKKLILTEHNEDGTHNMDASGVTSGVFELERIPAMDSAHVPNLDASKITTGTFPNARLPVAIAYEDEANIFTLNQKISKTRPELQFLHSGTTLARVGQYTANAAVFAENLSFDGTNWNLDDVSVPGMVVLMDPVSTGLSIYKASAGANPRTLTLLWQTTLNDTQAGTWTPTLSFGGSSTGITYTTRQGSYSRTGNVVIADLDIVLSSKGSATGSAVISGLPFNSLHRGTAPVNMVNMSGLTSSVYGVTIEATGNIFLDYAVAAGDSTLADTNFTNTSTLHFTVTYRV
jgi:hypothetical protein